MIRFIYKERIPKRNGSGKWNSNLEYSGKGGERHEMVQSFFDGIGMLGECSYHNNRQLRMQSYFV